MRPAVPGRAGDDEKGATTARLFRYPVTMAEIFTRHRQPWKSEEVAKLRTLAGKGKGLKEIAKALNRSEESTKERAKEDGIGIAKLR